MHFSEDDLREALKRKDPGEGFTQRVMARVNQADAKNKISRAAEGRRWSLLHWWNLRPAWTFAVMAVLLLGFAWGGYQYSEYRHQLLAKLPIFGDQISMPVQQIAEALFTINDRLRDSARRG